MTNQYCSWEDAVLWLRKQKGKEELVRACFFDDPLRESAKRYHDSTEWKEIQGILSKTKTGLALDLGAGRGISSYALAKDGWKVTALEPDRSNIVGAGAIRSLAAEERLDITVIENWGETIPFQENCFDLVYGRQVLHHARDLNKLCQEIHRVLRPGGIFIGTREHVISKKKDLQQFLDEHPLHNLYGGENAYTLREYKTAIMKSGIKLTKILAPFDSDINLFPMTKQDIKGTIVKRLGFNLPDFLSALMIPLLNYIYKKPGRVYSFIGYKG